MTKQDIISKVRSLNLPKGSFVVFGSGPLALADIRDVNDIDLLVSREIFSHLEKLGWKENKKGQNDRPLVFEEFEAHMDWNFSSYQPSLDHLLKTASVVDDVAFASIQEVRNWKASSARPKDLIDIEKIDLYLSKIAKP